MYARIIDTTNNTVRPVASLYGVPCVLYGTLCTVETAPVDYARFGVRAGDLLVGDPEFRLPATHPLSQAIIRRRRQRDARRVAELARDGKPSRYRMLALLRKRAAVRAAKGE